MTEAEILPHAGFCLTRCAEPKHPCLGEGRTSRGLHPMRYWSARQAMLTATRPQMSNLVADSRKVP